MKTTILKQSLILLSSATLLAACGGDGGDSPVDDGGANPGESGAQALLYAYPDNGQGEVPTKAPIALRFTSTVSLGNVNQSITLCCDEGGGNLDFTAEKVPGEPRGVLLTPTERLMPQTEYTVQISDLRLSRGTAKDQTLTFKTRPLQEGAKSQVVESDDFVVDRQFPNGSALEPVMDFSSFRLQFTQPIDRTTAAYGDGNTVVLRDSGGAEVEAGLLVDGAYMTVDPTADYLTPGETYTLELTGGLESTYGEAFAGQTIEFTPKDSSPRGEPGFLVQKITQSGTSRLTGKAINQVPVNGVLLGEDDNITQAQSDYVIAELADVTQYTDVTPIRLPKGTLLEGTPIETVLIGGEVDAGFGSGAVTMRILSDATGYLVPNPYTENHPDKLRIVHLFMDVGIATENPKANGGFTQNLLHIHLVGVAEVDPNGGVLNIDATSMVEPDVLGLEYGYGLLSFQLQSYKDQTDTLLADARAALEDITPPTLQSWMADQTSPEMPADESGDELSWFQHPGAPIVLNFDEPLDPESLTQSGALTVTRDGTTLDITHKVDGAALVIQPEEALQYLEAGNNPAYQIQLGSQITDLAGNNFVPETLTFKLPGEATTRSIPDGDGNYSEEDVQVNSPMLLSAYPGYPCVVEEEDILNLNLDSGLVGRCAGGPQEDWGSEDYPLIDYHPDDDLPLMTLPADRPIVLQFTKAIDPASVQLGGSFDIFRVDASGQPIDGETIQGSLTVEGQRITFVPDEPWEADEYYQYILGSNNDTGLAEGYVSGWALLGSEEAVCDGTESICGEDGHPLRTQPLGVATRVAINTNDAGGVFRVVTDYFIANKYFIPGGGGPDLAIFFKGEPASNDVLQTLRTSPDIDTNGNLIHDAENVIGKLPSELGGAPPFYNTDPATDTPLPDGTFPTVDYAFQEAVPSVPDPDADPDYDPEGVQGLPNSAKILSMNTRGTQAPDVPWFAEGADFAADPFTGWGLSGFASVDGGNVGCGYDEAYDPVTGDAGYYNVAQNDPMTAIGYLLANQYPESEPVICPEKKFTYLKMGLNASVGRYDEEKEAIKVEIYPSQAISTSFVTYARNAIGGHVTLTVPSGEQIMRMRYAKDDPACNDTPSTRCLRTQPITGWIKKGDNGPVLTADVDLYIDAPLLGQSLGNTAVNMSHTLRSYETTMSLTGPVSFLDDGRMIVQQRNENPIDIDLKVMFNREDDSAAANGIAMGSIPYRIPADGVFLQMVSEPIKSME